MQLSFISALKVNLITEEAKYMWTYKFEDVTAIQSSFFSQPNQLKNVVYHGETKEKALRTETFIVSYGCHLYRAN